MKRYSAAAIGVLGLAACATYQAYDGPAHSSSDTAIVRGDAKLRAALPLALVIRSVDGRAVDLRYSSVALAAGHHEIIVDCQVGDAKGTTSRHHVVLDVQGGERYRLQADMKPRDKTCERVYLASD